MAGLDVINGMWVCAADGNYFTYIYIYISMYLFHFYIQ